MKSFLLRLARWRTLIDLRSRTDRKQASSVLFHHLLLFLSYRPSSVGRRLLSGRETNLSRLLERRNGTSEVRYIIPSQDFTESVLRFFYKDQISFSPGSVNPSTELAELGQFYADFLGERMRTTVGEEKQNKENGTWSGKEDDRGKDGRGTKPGRC